MKTMNPLDSTYYLRRMKSFPRFFFFSFYSVLLTLLVIFLIGSPDYRCFRPLFPTFNNPDFNFDNESMILVALRSNGRIYFRFSELDTDNNFDQMLADYIEEMGLDIDGIKIAFTADEDVEFSRVSKMFRTLHALGIYNIFLSGGSTTYAKLLFYYKVLEK